MPTDERYHIYTNSPVPLDLAQYAIQPDDTATESGLARTILEGRFTIEEFQRMFGPDASIIHAMCREDADANFFSIRIFASDVLACENHVKSHQGELINHLRDTEGMAPLEEKDIDRATRSYHDLTPEALQILLNAAGREIDPFTMDMDRAVREMEEAGLNLTDFVRAA